jgi:hypothetical protein
MAQTTIAARAAGIEGDRAEESPGDVIKSYELEDATDVPFGRCVRQDPAGAAGDRSAELPATAADFVVGYALQDPTIEADPDGTREYSQRDVMSVLQRGSAWALSEQAVNPGDPVFVRITAGGAGQTPGRLRADADETVGITPQVRLTLSGPLDGGTPQMQTLTWSGATEAADTYNLDVDGTSITQQTFTGDNDRYLRNIADAMIEASLLAGTGPDNTPSIESIVVTPVGANATDDREMIVQSKPGSATVFANSVFVDASAGGVTCTLATPQANADPHTCTAAVDGDTLTMPWIGDSDATWLAFADLLAAHQNVATAAVLKLDDADATPEMVLTGANAAVDDIDVAGANPTGGATARTVTIDNEERAGVAAVAARAVALANCVWRTTTAGADALAVADFNLP